jgi:MoaA/NifB/PqqE/SkfB family radical SAM enzyme
MLKTTNSALLRLAINYLGENPLENLPKVINIAEKFAVKDTDKQAVDYYKKILNDPENNYAKMLKRFIGSINPDCLKKMMTNFVINSGFNGRKLADRKSKEIGVNIPWTILIDPTNACNLKCKGCWSAEYDKTSSLSFETLDRIIREGKELGIYMYIYSGGEPFLRKNDIIKLCKIHDDCMFSCFTNGTLIDDRCAGELAEVNNFIPGISIEGWEKETDLRRGNGTFTKVVKAMDCLKKANVPFGFSICYHSKNYDLVVSDDFIDFMIDKGAYFGWYFTYIPIGKSAVMDLMADAEQRKYVYCKIRNLRQRKPIFVMDFWNDGEFVNGCIAGGRKFFHINAGGDVEPCAFIHYANLNINSCSLKEALRSPLFVEYQLNQPFNENHLRPCPLLDNPPMLRKMVKDSNAFSTQSFDNESVDNLTKKCEKTAYYWSITADELWESKEGKNTGAKEKVSI